jgi:GNAT superfamily N-acetyltransferase
VTDIGVLAATPDRWDDVASLLGGDGDKGCWCQAWRGVEVKGEPRPDALRRQLAMNHVPPGYLAYLDGEPVGWVGVSVRTLTPRLVNSRTIPAVDDLPVWSIGCFRIRPGYRRRGVATVLLDAVVAEARAAGAPAVEAYPIDPDGRRVDVAQGFVGIASMFDRAGFRRVLETKAHSAGLPRILVRLDLPGQNPGT